MLIISNIFTVYFSINKFKFISGGSRDGANCNLYRGGGGGGGVNLILPHSGSQKRQNWDEVK